MSNMHLMAIDGNEFDVVFHFAVPNTTNTSGVNWRTVVLRQGYGTTELPDGDGTGGTISAAEKTSITSGALVEVRKRVKPGTAAFPTGAQLDAIFAAEQAAWQSDFQSKYARYGGAR